MAITQESKESIVQSFVNAWGDTSSFIADAVTPDISDASFHASMAAAYNDFTDQVAIRIYEETGDKAAALAASNVLVR